MIRKEPHPQEGSHKNGTFSCRSIVFFIMYSLISNGVYTIPFSFFSSDETRLSKQVTKSCKDIRNPCAESCFSTRFTSCLSAFVSAEIKFGNCSIFRVLSLTKIATNTETILWASTVSWDLLHILLMIWIMVIILLRSANQCD